jgi:hypothetical protein
MYENLPDALVLMGFVLLITGVVLVWGYEIALLVSGVLLLAAGAAAAWRQSN